MEITHDIHSYCTLISLLGTAPGHWDEIINTYSDRNNRFKDQLKDHVTQYNAISARTTENERLELYLNHIYNPQFFRIFGTFDLAVMDLIDDLDVINRLSNLKSTTSQQFVVGCVPIFKSLGLFDNNTLSEDFNNGTLGEFPLFAIAQFSISPLLKILYGNYIIQKTMQVINENHFFTEEYKNNTFKAYGILPLCWSDIAIIFFSKNYTNVANTVIDLRKFKLFDILDKQAFENQLPYNIKKIFFHKLFENTSVDQDSIENHLFNKSYSIFGFNQKIYEKIKGGTKKKYFQGIIKGDIQTLIKFACKPGHSKDMLSYFDKMKMEKTASIFGTFDIGLSNPNSKPIKTLDFLYEYCTLLRELTRHGPPIFESINTSIMLDLISIDLGEGYSLCDNHAIYEKLLEIVTKLYDSEIENDIAHNAYNRTTNEVLFTVLKTLEVPKNLRVSLFQLYDKFFIKLGRRTLFSSLLELYPYIDKTINELLYSKIDITIDVGKKKRSKKEKQDINTHQFDNFIKDIIKQIQYIENGIMSRIRSDYHMKEVGDHTIQLPGNFIKILSAINCVHRFSTGLINDKIDNACFSYIGDRPTPLISTSHGSVIELNWIALVQPEYLITMQHEIGHYQAENSKYKKFKEYYEDCDAIELADEIFADAYSFYFAFGGAPSLFLRFNLSYFSTDINCKYFKESYIRQFNITLIRFLIQIKNWRKDKDVDKWIEENIDTVDNIDEFNLDHKIKSHVRKKLKNGLEEYKNTNKFLNLYFSNKVNKRVRSWAFQNFVLYYIQIYDMFAENLRILHAELEKDYKKTYKSLLRNDKNIINNISNGRISSKSKARSSKLLPSILVAELVEAVLEYNKIEMPILYRDDDGNIEIKQGSKSVLFDPHGGTCIYDIDIRRKILKSRLSLIYILYDLAEKQKIKILDNIINKSHLSDCDK